MQIFSYSISNYDLLKNFTKKLQDSAHKSVKKNSLNFIMHLHAWKTEDILLP